MTNTADETQRDAWNGESGLRWAADPDKRDAAMVDVAAALADAAGLRPGEDVLDIGCGCAATSLDAARAVGPGGTVLGIDISEPMLAVARRRLTASALDNITFGAADAQTDPLPEQAHDVVISRFGTMFFDHPTTAFANLARCLRTSGRLCIATWQPLEANDWLAIPGAALLRYGTLPDTGGNAPGMFAQSDTAVISTVLTTAGFDDITVTPVTVTMRLGANAEEATGYLTDTGIARTILDTIPPDRREEAVESVTAVLADHEGPTGVVLGAGIWITTATTRT